MDSWDGNVYLKQGRPQDFKARIKADIKSCQPEVKASEIPAIIEI